LSFSGVLNKKLVLFGLGRDEIIQHKINQQKPTGIVFLPLLNRPNTLLKPVHILPEPPHQQPTNLIYPLFHIDIVRNANLILLVKVQILALVGDFLLFGAAELFEVLFY
jgi:hypothetical protein